MSKILLVGQAPNRTGTPHLPLLGKVGEKIAAMAGLSADQYLTTFNRINILSHYPGKSGKGDAFPITRARHQARKIRLPRETIFIGKQAAAAFGFNVPFLTWLYIDGRRRVAILPHPSGINSWYNNPSNQKKCNTFVHLAVTRNIRKSH